MEWSAYSALHETVPLLCHPTSTATLSERIGGLLLIAYHQKCLSEIEIKSKSARMETNMVVGLVMYVFGIWKGELYGVKQRRKVIGKAGDDTINCLETSTCLVSSA
jgi:hypothetical protein